MKPFDVKSSKYIDFDNKEIIRKMLNLIPY